MALHIARPLRVSQKILYLLIGLASGITRGLLWLTGGRRSRIGLEAARRELKALAQIGEEHGMIVPQTRHMIQSVFDLGDRAVEAVMVRLSKTAGLSAEATVGEVEALAARTGYSHFPVYQTRRDNIVGIVNLTDIMYSPAGPDQPIETFVKREITRIPRGKSVGDLLQEFRYSQIPLAVVVDDAGRALGLLSPQDLLEEVVGTIRDERLAEEDQAD